MTNPDFFERLRTPECGFYEKVTGAANSVPAIATTSSYTAHEKLAVQIPASSSCSEPAKWFQNKSGGGKRLLPLQE